MFTGGIYGDMLYIADADAVGYINGKMQMPIQLDNDDEIVGMQFTILVPEKTKIYDIQLTNRQDNHTLTVTTPEWAGGGDARSVMITNNNANAFKGSNGAVLNVKLGVREGYGFYEQIESAHGFIQLRDIVLSAKGGNKITLPDMDIPFTIDASYFGDADDDGTIDVNDVQNCIKRALGDFDVQSSSRQADNAVLPDPQ